LTGARKGLRPKGSERSLVPFLDAFFRTDRSAEQRPGQARSETSAQSFATISPRARERAGPRPPSKAGFSTFGPEQNRLTHAAIRPLPAKTPLRSHDPSPETANRHQSRRSAPMTPLHASKPHFMPRVGAEGGWGAFSALVGAFKRRSSQQVRRQVSRPRTNLHPLVFGWYTRTPIYCRQAMSCGGTLARPSRAPFHAGSTELRASSLSSCRFL
jgi:hypothetical protein